MPGSSDGREAMHHGRMFFQPGLMRLFIMLLIWTPFISPVMIIVPVQAAAADQNGVVNCDIHHNACTQKLPGTRVVLDIYPKPVKAMTDLKFKIVLTGKLPKTAPYIDLGMPGMKMGPNRVLLRWQGNGVYEGTGIIVRCPSGKKIWKASVTIEDFGTAEFVFDVIY